jgi:AcrR family transcriptional regulator
MAARKSDEPVATLVQAPTTEAQVVPSERPGPRGGVRDRNRRERTRAILAAAVGLSLEGGVDRVTVDEIARGAGIAKASFYRYFEDRVGVIEALFAPIRASIEDAVAECDGSLGEAASLADVQMAWMRLGIRLAPLVLEHPELARLYLQEARGPAVGARAPIRALQAVIDASAVRLTRAVLARGLIRDLDPVVVAYVVVGAIERLVLLSLEEPNAQRDAAQVVDTLIAIVLDGVRLRAEK